jgi:hypothetical protein
MFASPLQDTIAGYTTAVASTLALWVADAAETIVPGSANLLQMGGTAGLIGGLSVGCYSLWRLVQSQRSEINELNREIREEWKSQSEELISVLRKLDK